MKGSQIFTYRPGGEGRYRPRRGGPVSACALLAAAGFFFFSLMGFSIDPAHGQNIRQFSHSYLTPFPIDNQYRLYVFGDSLGEEIGAGLRRAFANEGRFVVLRAIRHRTGLIGKSSSNIVSYVDTIIRGERVDIAVIMVGKNDYRKFSVENKTLKPGTSKWREAYAQQMNNFVRLLKAKNISVYWVGLPIVRSPKTNQNMQYLNEVYRQTAFLNGIKFIDTWNGFADQFGRYSAFGPDLSGTIRRLRTDDGVHFSYRGRRKLAHFVEHEIRRDLAIAKTERNIPLAGGEAVQNRLVRQVSKRSNALKKSAQKTSPWQEKVQLSKDQNQIIIIGDLKIIRPEIRNNDLATLFEYPHKKAAENLVGEMVVGVLQGELTAIGSVSLNNRFNLLSGGQSRPVTQTLYYKALIKGEKLTPKVGRRDDFVLH